MRDRRLDRPLLGWSLASVAVAVVSPYGWRGVAQTLTLATRLDAGHPFARAIGEYASPFALPISDQFPFYPKLPIFSFVALAILCVPALVVLFRRKRWDLCLLILAFLVPGAPDGAQHAAAGHRGASGPRLGPAGGLFFRRLGGREAALAFVPAMPYSGEPAWILSCWAGGYCQRLRWLMALYFQFQVQTP